MEKNSTKYEDARDLATRKKPFKTVEDFKKYLKEDHDEKKTFSTSEKIWKRFRSILVKDDENEFEAVAQVKDPREDKEEEYDLGKNEKKKGLAVIFSFPLLTKEREQKDLDGAALCFLFEKIFGEQDVFYVPNFEFDRVKQFLQDIVSDKNVADGYNSLTIAILSEEKPSNSSKIVVAGKESTSPMEITVKKFLNGIDEELWIDKPKLVIVNAPR